MPQRLPTADEIVAFVAANVRHLRVRRGLTQEGLAELADIPPLRVQRVERGEADVRVTVLVALARALNVPLARLFNARELTERREGRPRARRPRAEP